MTAAAASARAGPGVRAARAAAIGRRRGVARRRIVIAGGPWDPIAPRDRADQRNAHDPDSTTISIRYA